MKRRDNPIGGSISRGPRDNPIGGSISRGPRDNPIGGSISRGPRDNPIRGSISRGPRDNPIGSISMGPRDNPAKENNQGISVVDVIHRTTTVGFIVSKIPAVRNRAVDGMVRGAPVDFIARAAWH